MGQISRFNPSRSRAYSMIPFAASVAKPSPQRHLSMRNASSTSFVPSIVHGEQSAAAKKRSGRLFDRGPSANASVLPDARRETTPARRAFARVSASSPENTGGFRGPARARKRLKVVSLKASQREPLGSKDDHGTSVRMINSERFCTPTARGGLVRIEIRSGPPAPAHSTAGKRSLAMRIRPVPGEDSCVSGRRLP